MVIDRLIQRKLKIYQRQFFAIFYRVPPPQNELCIQYVWVHGNVWICTQCVNFIVCVEECVGICVYSSCVCVCVCVCLCVCMLCVCVFVLPGCVWLCQAIWSAVWGAHYPLSSAVGSGALSICPSIPPSHPLSLSIFFFLSLSLVKTLFYIFFFCTSLYVSSLSKRSMFRLYFILNIIQK